MIFRIKLFVIYMYLLFRKAFFQFCELILSFRLNEDSVKNVFQYYSLFLHSSLKKNIHTGIV